MRTDYRELILVEGGAPLLPVVISPEASEKVRAAALDFIELTEKMTGVRMPLLESFDDREAQVVIGVSDQAINRGIGPFTEKDPETVCLKREGDTLILAGNDSGLFQGTQFAVTMFFEQLGCGWFGPDELWHEIPKRDTVSVGYLDVCHHPQFLSRRSNVLANCPEIGERWYLGGEYRVSGHMLQTLIGREDYFPSHPEWFCLIDGKRNPYIEWWQYCYSNEQLIQCFIQKIKAVFKNDSSVTQFSITANDGWHHGFCECDECRRMGNSSDQILTFANRIAEGILSEYPHHRLTVLSYFPTYAPPTRPYRMQPNIEIMFCKETDMFAPVDKGPNTGYHVKYTFDESKNVYPAPWTTHFEEWRTIVHAEHICIWDWGCIAAANEVWKDIPWVQGDVQTRNNRFWLASGVEYVYNDQGPLVEFHEDLESFPLRFPLWHVIAKSWWDKDLTGSEILLDACKKLYGSAAFVLYSIYQCMADAANNCRAKSLAWHPPKPGEVYGVSTVNVIDSLFEAAEQLAEQDSFKVQKRVRIQNELWIKARDIIINS